MHPVIVFHRPHNIGHRIVPAGGTLDWNDPQDRAFFQRTLRWSVARVEFRAHPEVLESVSKAPLDELGEPASDEAPAKPKRRSKA